MAYIKTIPTEEGVQFIDRNGQLIHFIAYSNIVTIEAGYDYFCFINKEYNRYVAVVTDRILRQQLIEIFAAQHNILVLNFEERTRCICYTMYNDEIIFNDYCFYIVDQQGFVINLLNYNEIDIYDILDDYTIKFTTDDNKDLVLILDDPDTVDTVISIIDKR